MPPVNHLYQWLCSTLKFYSGAGSYITRLPPDIFLDEIFTLLRVEDIVRIRQVNRAFYVITHEPVIWRRFLERLHIPRPTLRPTLRYHHESSNYEIELLVTQSCAVDKAWRQGMPEIITHRDLEAHLEIVDLKLLPGGKFLVASVKDRCNYRFYIYLYVLDDRNGSRLLARLPTHYKLNNLQAKYMDYEGVPGIMIAFTRMRFVHGAAEGADSNDYSYYARKLETPQPLIYEIVCVHARLDNLENLLNFEDQLRSQEYRQMLFDMPSPFQSVFQYESRSYIMKPTLFEYEDEFKAPCLSFIRQGTAIYIVDLLSGRFSVIRCTPHPALINKRHDIEAIRPFPGQTHQILVVRTVYHRRDYPEVLLVESYDLPTETGEFLLSSTSCVYEDVSHTALKNFIISDPDLPLEKTAPDHPNIIGEDDAPPTLWVFAETEDLKGLAFFYIRPERIESWTREKGTTYFYQYRTNSISRMLRHTCAPHTEHVLPGTERSLIYTVNGANRSDTPTVFKLRRFVPHDLDDSFPPIEPLHPVTDRVDKSIFAFTDIPRSENVSCQINQAGGLAAITWDEGSGRVCMAAKNEDKIRVLDFCAVVEPRKRLAFYWRQVLQSHSG